MCQHYLSEDKIEDKSVNIYVIQLRNHRIIQEIQVGTKKKLSYCHKKVCFITNVKNVNSIVRHILFWTSYSVPEYKIGQIIYRFNLLIRKRLPTQMSTEPSSSIAKFTNFLTSSGLQTSQAVPITLACDKVFLSFFLATDKPSWMFSSSSLMVWRTDSGLPSQKENI